MSNLYGAKEAKRCRVMLNSLSPVKEYLVSNLDVVDWAFMGSSSNNALDRPEFIWVTLDTFKKK